MDERTRNGARPHDGRPGSLGELIHAAVRRTIEVAVDEELTAALGARPYERGGQRRGYRNGNRLLRSQARYEATAAPFQWTFTPRDLHRLRSSSLTGPGGASPRDP